MTPEQQTAYVQAQATCALIEAMGMHAENMQRQSIGMSMAYDSEAFGGLIEQYGIHHNAVIGLFNQ